ncbi:MAG: 23S rRNA (pseudouridine(1915)-N(3))-methyltransferase RlmH [Pseudomonadota bacterium]
MNIRIVAVGRIKSGPEQDLINDYVNRFRKTGRGIGLGSLEILEIDERKAATKGAASGQILPILGAESHVWACDEHGEDMTSPKFADALRFSIDTGVSSIAFVIGGADGLDKNVLDRAHKSISFGKMVWPHKLVRVMLTEQLYRAVTILSGRPYHRE